MSFARTKFNRLNENQASTNTSGATKSDTPRSQIPKITRSYASSGTPRTSDVTRAKRDLHRKPITPKKVDSDVLEELKPCNLEALAENTTPGEGEIMMDLELSDVQKNTYNTRQDSIVSKTSSSGIPMPTSTSKLSKNTRKPRSLSVNSGRPSPRTSTVEYQFLAKKKRLDQLKREVELKQKPILDLYNALVELKSKMEANGMTVPLESVKLIDFGGVLSPPHEENSTESNNELSEEQIAIAADRNAEYLRTLEGELDPVPITFSELGKYLMSTREKLIDQLTKLKNGDVDKDDMNLEAFELETKQLNGLINDAIERQEIRVKRILTEAQTLTENNNLVTANQLIKHLEAKLKETNESLVEVSEELERTQRQVEEAKNGQINEFVDENNELKDQIISLEAELQTKKKKIIDLNQASKNYEQKIELLNKQVHELDKGKKEAESKINDMSISVRNLQTKMKNTEQRWREEKEEILKNHKGEHAILEKLTAERQTLDTRVHLMNTILDEQKRNNDEEQGKLRKEIAALKETLESAAVEKQILKDKMECMKQELGQLSIQQQQAIELMKNSMAENEEKRSDDSCISEREAQLRSELLAVKVALKAAQERIETYSTEKLRFIDNIERLNCDGNSTKESLSKALVEKEEYITRLEREKIEANRLIEQQKMQISQLLAKVENFQAGVVINHLDTVPRDTQELKALLEEGKAKLQRALAKSLDNEQKLIKYEHDINQHKKQLNDMENLLKVRDGLIGMLKAKKDELMLENESLHKYSEEVRQLLFDTKEELKQKCDVIHDLTGNLDSKGRLCVKLEKKVKALESTLSDTNAKRFKLQESVGTMEKELQTTKAHISQISELQTRYDLAMTGTKVDSLDGEESIYDDFYNDDDEEACSVITTGSSRIYQYHHEGGDHSIIQPEYLDHNLDGFEGRDVYRERIAAKLAAMPRNLPPLHEDLFENRNYKTALVNRPNGDCSRLLTQQNLQDWRQMYYYFKMPQNDFNMYTKYLGKMSPNSIYNYYHVYNPKQVLKKQSRIDPEPSDTNLRFLVYPKSDSNLSSIASVDGDDPYKVYYDIFEEEDNRTVSNKTEQNSKAKERQEFIEIVGRLYKYDKRGREKLGLGQEFTPILFGGVSRYKILDRGSLMWCTPSQNMRLNNMLIANDIQAQRTSNVQFKSNESI